ADAERLCGEKWRSAKFRIVTDGKIFRGQRACEKRKTQISKFDLAAQSLRSLCLDGGAETIHGDEEGRNEEEDNHDGDDDDDDAKFFAHENLRKTRNGKGFERRQG